MLFDSIGTRDHQRASQLLAESPQLARATLTGGANRSNASAFFLRQVSHYLYAGDTALHVASAAYQRDFAVELVRRHASVRAKNRRGAEPLHYAADGAPGGPLWDPDAQYAIIEYLVGAGADPDSADKSGVSPLHRAVRTRSTAAVQALIRNGADVVRRNGTGSTPLHLAVQYTGRGGSGSAMARREQGKIIRFLLDNGASLTDTDRAGKTVKECVRSESVRALISGF